MFNKNLLIAGLAATIAVPAAAAPFQFDVDGDGDPTQAGFASITDANSGAVDGTLQGTDDGVTVTITGFASSAGRDRGTAASTPGADNNDNNVPEGTFSALYRDFYFAGNGVTVTVNLSGLDASTEYFVTAFSYDSGAFGGGTPVNQDFLVGTDIVGNIAYSGDLSSGLGPDPDTNALTDNSTTFSITTDGSGNATFTTVSSGGQGARLNGLIVDVPEPSSLALLSLGGLAMLRRRRG